MSAPATNLSNFIRENLESVLPKQVEGKETLAHDDPRLIAFNRFLDSAIKIATSDDNLSKPEAFAAVEEHLKGTALFANSLKQALKQKQKEHTESVDNSFSDNLRKSAEGLGELSSLVDRNIKPGELGREDYKEASLEDVQKDFLSYLNNMAKDPELKDLSKENRRVASAKKLGEWTQVLVKEYGSNKVQAFSDSIKDSQLASYVYLAQSESSEKLPGYELSSEANEILGDADFSNISRDDKQEVTNLIKSFFANLDENGEASEQAKFAHGEAFAKLKPEQQAFYEHSRSQAVEISKIASSPVELISKFTEKLPSMLVPGIIGAIASYLMGFGFIGGAAAIAINALGTSSDTAEIEKDLAKPPEYKVAA